MKLNIKWINNGGIAWLTNLAEVNYDTCIKVCENIREQQEIDIQTLKKEQHWVKSTLIQLFISKHFCCIIYGG